MKQTPEPWRFPDELDLRALKTFREGRREYLLLADFRYISRRYGTILSPKGRVTDLASIPRALWRVHSHDGPLMWGSIPHDECYGHKTLPRDEADLMFREANIDSGVSHDEAELAYRMVRRFGEGGYGR